MFRLLLPIFIVCGFLAEAVVAAEYPYTPTSVRIGIENTYKNGLWTPITLEWESPVLEHGYYARLVIQCSDSDGTPVRYSYRITRDKEARDGNRAVVLAKLGRKDEPIQIAFHRGDEFTSYPVPSPVNAERPIYLIFGNDDIGLQGAVAELMLREDRRPLLVKVNSFDDLPTEWFGYEAVEMVVLTTTEPELFAGLTADCPKIKALDDWLKLGGKMLLCAGKDAGQFLEPNDGVLRPFFPGQFAGMTEMRSGTPFELFVNSKRQIFMNGTEEAPFMRMPRIVEQRGMISMQDGDLPLVLRCAHGLGTIIYFGGDLSERPLKNWRDRTILVRNIMQWNRTPERGVLTPRSGGMLQLGYNDIAGQIRSALDQFEGVRVVPFSVILIILTAYWLVIGLFDWFFVHKVLKRPILTWVTFPLWIVLFSVLTYVLAVSGRLSDTLLVNPLHIYDADHETGVMRTSHWRNVYSSIEQHYGYDILSDSDNDYFSWFGLPGSGLGGMAPKTVSPHVWQVGSRQDSYRKIVDVPIQTHSTKSFFAQRVEPQREESKWIAAKLSDEEGVPVGTIEVPEDFYYPLQNCILVYGRWALELGEIAPGQTIRVTKTTPRREMRDLLMPPQTLDNAALHGFAAYNPQSTDLEYIVRVMSLHRALGGFETTGLHHAYQPSLDMSDLLTVDRALFLGRVESQLDMFYRSPLPITLTESSPRWRGERSDTTGGVLDEPVRPGFVNPGAGR